MEGEYAMKERAITNGAIAASLIWGLALAAALLISGCDHTRLYVGGGERVYYRAEPCGYAYYDGLYYWTCPYNYRPYPYVYRSYSPIPGYEDYAKKEGVQKKETREERRRVRNRTGETRNASGERPTRER